MIERVDRLDDPRLAAYTHVADPRWLLENGLFVAEGRLVVRRLLEDGRFDVYSVLVTPTALHALEDLFAIPSAPHPVYVVGQDELNTLAGFNFHRGCLAMAQRPAPLAAASLHGAKLLVGLEGVGNPDNVGGIFRSAYAFGADGVLLDSSSADPLYRKAVRTSMAATLRLRFVQVLDWPGELEQLRAAGFRIVAFTPSPDAVDIATIEGSLPGKAVLLFGSEGDGLSASTLGLADAKVRIPIVPGSDSLNVAVAAGIALHHFSSI